MSQEDRQREGEEGGEAGGDCPAGGVTEVPGAGAHLRRSVLEALVTPVQPAAPQQHHCNQTVSFSFFSF